MIQVKSLKTYDVVVTFHNAPNKFRTIIRTDNLDRATACMGADLKRNSGLDLHSLLARERIIATKVTIDKITIECPHCNKNVVLYDIDTLEPDALGFKRIVCAGCKQDFYLESATPICLKALPI